MNPHYPWQMAGRNVEWCIFWLGDDFFRGKVCHHNGIATFQVSLDMWYDVAVIWCDAILETTFFFFYHMFFCFWRVVNWHLVDQTGRWGCRWYQLWWHKTFEWNQDCTGGQCPVPMELPMSQACSTFSELNKNLLHEMASVVLISHAFLALIYDDLPSGTLT